MSKLSETQKKVLDDMRAEYSRRGLSLTPVLDLENDFIHENCKMEAQRAADQEEFNKLSEADKKVFIAARRPGPYRGPSYEEYLELKRRSSWVSHEQNSYQEWFDHNLHW